MNHILEIGLAKHHSLDPILTSRTIRIGAGLFSKIFGRNKVLIIVPGGTVDTVTITEKKGEIGTYDDG